MRKFALALLMMIIPIPWLTGCGTIHFSGLSVIEEPDGVVVTNCTSDFTIVVHKLGGTETGVVTRVVSSPQLPPGGSWIADTKNLSYNRYDNVLIWVDVYRHGTYVGEAKFRGGSVSVPPNTAYRDLWPVHDSDLRFRSADHDCP